MSVVIRRRKIAVEEEPPAPPVRISKPNMSGKKKTPGRPSKIDLEEFDKRQGIAALIEVKTQIVKDFYSKVSDLLAKGKTVEARQVVNTARTLEQDLAAYARELEREGNPPLVQQPGEEAKEPRTEPEDSWDGDFEMGGEDDFGSGIHHETILKIHEEIDGNDSHSEFHGDEQEGEGERAEIPDSKGSAPLTIRRKDKQGDAFRLGQGQKGIQEDMERPRED